MRFIAQRMQHKDEQRNRALAARTAKEKYTMPDRLSLAPVTSAAVGAPAVTDDHLALIRKTIAKDATPEELQLFLYDNARQGVHPLDKLIHFTKRSGKYTPVTSIDFLRIRAADSGDCAGIDDPRFDGVPKSPGFTATVTVHRLVQGQRCPFTATARWSEYKPDQAFMWEKMPHTMLGKCAEALALRKGFPKQLGGLYVREEMEQASVDILPAPARSHARAESSPTPAIEKPDRAAPADMNEQIPDAWQPFVEAPVDLPDRLRGRIVDVETESKAGRKSGSNYTKTTVTLDSGEIATTLNLELGATALACKASGALVEITTKATRWGSDIVTIARLPDEGEDAEAF